MKFCLTNKILLWFCLTLCLFLLADCSKVYAANGVYDWSKRLGGTGSDTGNRVATDSNNNIIVTGYVVGDADLNGDGDRIDGGAESGTGYGSYDGFISVFNASGIYQWSKRFGGTGNDSCSSTVDSNNRIIITGYVTGDADLNGDGDTTDGGAESSTGYGGTDIFISVFNANGTYQWSKRLGGINSDSGNYVTSYTYNNIYITGGVTGDADLNGDGDTTDGGAESGTGYGSYDGFISVFNSSGAYQWSTRLGGTGVDISKTVSIDANNNMIITGQVTGDADLNGDGDRIDGGAESGTGYGSYDGFISVFNASGIYQWSKRLGGTSYDNCFATVDSDNRIIVTGMTVADMDLNGDGDMTDGGAESISGYGGPDIYISVFSANGTYQWSKRLGGINSDNGNYVTSDTDNNIYITGGVTGDVDLNGDGDTTDGGAESGVGYGGTDVFISVFNSSGIYQWSKRSGGVSGDVGNSIVSDNNNLIITGMIKLDADLNGDGDSTDGGAESAVGYGNDDIFISVFSTQAPTISLTPLSPDPSSDTTPSLSGTATGVLGTVTSVEYQMDGTSGSWTACSADDGAFDETSEAFTCATPSSSPLSDGSHTIYIRSTDSNTNTTSLGSETTDTFTVDTGAPADSGFRIGTSKGVNNSKLQDEGNTITYDKREIKLYLSAKDSISDVAYMMVSQDKLFRNATWKDL